MDTLVALGATAAFVYSTYALFAMTGAQVRGDEQAVMNYMMDFYFESAAMILTLITVGKTLEARSKGKTTDALRSLMELAPKTATIERDGAEVTVPVEQVQTGDVFIVRPGERIPVDGVVLAGTSAVNEAALTGESIPADKSAGRGRLGRDGEPVGLSQVPRHARRRGHDALADHPDGQRRGGHESANRQDRRQGVRRVRTGGHGHRTRDVRRLAAARPHRGLRARARHLRAGHQLPVCARHSIPLSIFGGIGCASTKGILVKGSNYLEALADARYFVFDKTGTLTKGVFEVTSIDVKQGTEENCCITQHMRKVPPAIRSRSLCKLHMAVSSSAPKSARSKKLPDRAFPQTLTGMSSVPATCV